MPSYETAIQKVAVVRQDGGVSIMSFIISGRGHILPDGATWVDQPRGIWSRLASRTLVQAEVSRAVPDAVSWNFVLDEDVPEDRVFRNALVMGADGLKYDVDRAKAVVLEEVRHDRAKKLAVLDVEFTKAAGAAMLSNDFTEARRVENERQALRDLPAVVAVQMAPISSVEELKKFLPE